MRHRSSFGHLQIPLILIAVIFWVSGCVSSAEVKLASSQMTLAIDEYDQNIARFRDLWIAEIDKTLDDLGKAMVVRAVKNRIEILSSKTNNFSNAHWRNLFKRKGMIALSEEIETTQEAARSYVKALMKYKIDSAAEEAGIGKFNETISEQAIEALEGMKKAGISTSDIQATQDAINNQKTMMDDPIIASYGQQIIDWRALKQDIPEGLKNLQNVIQALKTTHQTVDGWIQTDAKVSGEQLGQLVIKHEKTLGL